MSNSLEPPVYVTEKTVLCNGVFDAAFENAHPVVYLPIKDCRAQCPYCGCIFVYEET